MYVRTKHLVTVAFASCVLATTASGSLRDTSVADPLGDAGGGPDIVSFEIGETAGVLTFTIRVAPGQLPVPVLFGVNFDVDRDPATGRRGEDAIATWISSDAGRTGSLALSRWNGAEFADAPTPGATASFSDGAFTLSLPAGLLGSASFAARAGTLALDPFGRDYAPDSPGYATFDVAQPIPPPASPNRLSASKPASVPRVPLAGKRFVISMQVRRSDTGSLPAAEVECRAWIPGRGVVLATPRFRGGSASCTMRVPAGSRGRRLRGTIAVTEPETELMVTRGYTYRII